MQVWKVCPRCRVLYLLGGLLLLKVDDEEGMLMGNKVHTLELPFLPKLCKKENFLCVVNLEAYEVKSL